MSDLSKAFHMFASATHGAITNLLDAVGMDPNTKAQVLGNMNSAMQNLGNAVEASAVSEGEQVAADLGANVTPSPSPIATPATALATVESVAGQAVESMADAEITALTGPAAPLATQIANKLLEAVGGDISQALGHLFGAKQASVAAEHPAETAAPAGGSPR